MHAHLVNTESESMEAEEREGREAIEAEWRDGREKGGMVEGGREGMSVGGIGSHGAARVRSMSCLSRPETSQTPVQQTNSIHPYS